MSPVPDWRWAEQWLPEGRMVVQVAVEFRGRTGVKRTYLNDPGIDEVQYAASKAAQEALRACLVEEYGLNDAKLGRDHFAPPGWKPESEK